MLQIAENSQITGFEDFYNLRSLCPEVRNEAISFVKKLEKVPIEKIRKNSKYDLHDLVVGMYKEMRVIDAIEKSILPMQEYVDAILMNNILIECRGIKHQIDHVLIGPPAAYTIETKNWTRETAQKISRRGITNEYDTYVQIRLNSGVLYNYIKDALGVCSPEGYHSNILCGTPKAFPDVPQDILLIDPVSDLPNKVELEQKINRDFCRKIQVVVASKIEFFRQSKKE